MSTFKMLEDVLHTKGCFESTMHPAFERAVECISPIASYKMKLMMAVTEIAVFTSQLRKPIKLTDNTIVPVNIMSFVLAGSGESKDSSVAMVRKALLPAYEVIDNYRRSHAKAAAEQKARFNGEEDSNYTKYYIEPRELLAGMGSVEGQMFHWHLLEQGKLGAAYIQVSELGSELQTSKDISSNIEALAKGYDLGRITSKIVKSNEGQVPSIKCLPISSLMFGAEEAILYNDSIKRKFKEEFMSKLSRRSYFNFNQEIIENIAYTSPADLFKAKQEAKLRSVEAVNSLVPIFTSLVTSTNQEPLTLTPEAEYLYEIYLEYNDLKSQLMSKLHPLCSLARKHMHWKAQKLAGTIAILESSPVITEEHLIYAMRFGELFSEDLAAFEVELTKEPYELFAAFMRTKAVDHKATITTHAMRKMNYIPSTGSPASRIAELVTLVTSYDKDAIYTATTEGISFEQIVKTPSAGVSFVPVSGTKDQRAKQCASGFTFAETDFAALADMLSGDFAYTPFQFKDNRRSKDNIIGGVKWLVLDIDTSTITASEAHEILADINHHIALTSDPDNDFKFRVLVELDSYAEVQPLAWKHFTKSIADYLSLTADLLPQSQIYFSYSGREILSVTNKSKIEVRDHILYATAQLAAKPERPKPVTQAENQALLQDKLGTFGYCFDALPGTGSRSMIRMMHHAKSLGLSNSEIEDLIIEANDYWASPMEHNRLENTILSQVRRL